jgi:hypothetical protein
VGFYFVLLLVRAGCRWVPRNYLNSKYDLSIHFIAKYFWELGAGSRELGNANSEDELKNEQKASETRAKYQQKGEPGLQANGVAMTRKSLAQKRGLFLFPSKFRIADWKNKNAGIGGVSETNAQASERS